MDTTRFCIRCKSNLVIVDPVSNARVCESCGFEKDFDNFQSQPIRSDGPQGSYVRIGTVHGNSDYRERKIYNSNKKIEETTQKLGFSALRSDEVKRMVEEISEGEFGAGEWFSVLIGACCYVVMRKHSIPLSIAEVAATVGCDICAIGRMVYRVREFLDLELPRFDIVAAFDRAVQNCPSFTVVAKEKLDLVVKQGRFLLMWCVKWFLTTGRQPLPMVAAILAFVAEVNRVDADLVDIAKSIYAGVSTTKLRYKEVKETLVKVARALPWGKDITVKNIANNMPLVIQYMELKMKSKSSSVENSNRIVLDLEEMVSGCLRDEFAYGSEKDSQYFELEENRHGMLDTSCDDLEKLKLSKECLFRTYTEYLGRLASVKSANEIGTNHKRKRKRASEFGEYNEWQLTESQLSKRVSLEQILEKNAGFDSLPPSFVAGTEARKRRREKITAAKLRIDEIMSPRMDVSIGKQLQNGVEDSSIDWEDCIIELLLLHQANEEELEQGHYNRLLDLHVFNSSSSLELVVR